MNLPVYTIGHSTHTKEHFLELLLANKITAVADVRSTPFSKFAPQFNQEENSAFLKSSGVAYVFLGRELGARREEISCYTNRTVNFDKVRKASLFLDGIERLKKGLEKYRIALLCVEKNPLDCHRTMLVSRHLVETGIPVSHILEDGTTITHQKLLDELLVLSRLNKEDLFMSEAEIIKKAYEHQNERVAYKIAENNSEDKSGTSN